jgi:hypothetical protein
MTRLLSMVVGVPLLLLFTAQTAAAVTCHFPLY